MAETKRGYVPVIVVALIVAVGGALGASVFLGGKNAMPDTQQSAEASPADVSRREEGGVAPLDRTAVRGGVTVQALTESGQSLPAGGTNPPATGPDGNATSATGAVPPGTTAGSGEQGAFPSGAQNGGREAASDVPPARLGRDDTPTVGMLVPPDGGASASQEGVSSRSGSGARQVASRSAGGEDNVVRLVFVDDLAAFLARNYWPRGTHPSATRSGISTISLQWANLRYGGEMPGIRGGDGSPSRARSRVLDYVLTPSVVKNLYGLYADHFLAALETQADRRTVGEPGRERFLSSAEKKEMLSIYASRSRAIGNALKRYAADPALPERVRAYNRAADAVESARRAYLERVEAYDAVRHGGGRQQINRAKGAVEQAAGIYQESIVRREDAKNGLIEAMGGKADSGETLVYIASWAARRGDASKEGLRACGNAALAMAEKLARAAR